MGLLWAIFWPMAVGAAMIGGVAGVLFFGKHGIAPAKNRRVTIVMLGLVAVIAIALLSSGPLGAADRLTFLVERDARTTLTHYEMGQVDASLERSPLRRRLVMVGPADDFQRTELVRMMEELPGVEEARWNHHRALLPLPLFMEAMLLAFVGYLVGLVLAYIVELRRRSHGYDQY